MNFKSRPEGRLNCRARIGSSAWLRGSSQNSKSKTQYYDYYYGGVDVDEKMSGIGSASLTILYFGENLINPPSNPTEWSYFSVIVVHTRAFAFSPSNSPGAFAFRQKVNGVWQNWIYG